MFLQFFVKLSLTLLFSVVFCIQPEYIQGTMTLRIIAVNATVIDPSTAWDIGGKPDPYVRITVGTNEFFWWAQPNTYVPVWNTSHEWTGVSVNDASSVIIVIIDDGSLQTIGNGTYNLLHYARTTGTYFNTSITLPYVTFYFRVNLTATLTPCGSRIPISENCSSDIDVTACYYYVFGAMCSTTAPCSSSTCTQCNSSIANCYSSPNTDNCYWHNSYGCRDKDEYASCSISAGCPTCKSKWECTHKDGCTWNPRSSTCTGMASSLIQQCCADCEANNTNGTNGCNCTSTNGVCTCGDTDCSTCSSSICTQCNFSSAYCYSSTNPNCWWNNTYGCRDSEEYASCSISGSCYTCKSKWECTLNVSCTWYPSVNACVHTPTCESNCSMCTYSNCISQLSCKWVGGTSTGSCTTSLLPCDNWRCEYCSSSECSDTSGCAWSGSTTGGMCTTDPCSSTFCICTYLDCESLSSCKWIGGTYTGSCSSAERLSCSGSNCKNCTSSECSDTSGCAWSGSTTEGSCTTDTTPSCSSTNCVPCMYSSCESQSSCKWTGGISTGSCSSASTLSCSGSNCGNCTSSECSDTSGCAWSGSTTTGSCTTDTPPPTCNSTDCVSCTTPSTCSTADCYWGTAGPGCSDTPANVSDPDAWYNFMDTVACTDIVGPYLEYCEHIPSCHQTGPATCVFDTCITYEWGSNPSSCPHGCRRETWQGFAGCIDSTRGYDSCFDVRASLSALTCPATSSAADGAARCYTHTVDIPGLGTAYACVNYPVGGNSSAGYPKDESPTGLPNKTYPCGGSECASCASDRACSSLSDCAWDGSGCSPIKSKSGMAAATLITIIIVVVVVIIVVVAIVVSVVVIKKKNSSSGGTGGGGGEGRSAIELHNEQSPKDDEQAEVPLQHQPSYPQLSIYPPQQEQKDTDDEAMV